MTPVITAVPVVLVVPDTAVITAVVIIIVY